MTSQKISDYRILGNLNKQELKQEIQNRVKRCFIGFMKTSFSQYLESDDINIITEDIISLQMKNGDSNVAIFNELQYIEELPKLNKEEFEIRINCHGTKKISDYPILGNMNTQELKKEIKNRVKICFIGFMKASFSQFIESNDIDIISEEIISLQMKKEVSDELFSMNCNILKNSQNCIKNFKFKKLSWYQKMFKKLDSQNWNLNKKIL